MGSSTSYGYFPDGTSRDSSWTFKVNKYYKQAAIIDSIYNIAASGKDCYTGMPTSYIPPPGRNLPDPLYNISRVLNFSPKPDILIVNFPSNNYEWLSNEEILFCLRTIRDSAVANNIRCFVTTTQPREYSQFFEREKLKDLKSLIEAEFGVYSIDFWTDITLDPPIIIKPQFSAGDGIHLNPAGHTMLANIVIQKNIFFSPVAFSLMNFTTLQQNKIVKLSWFSQPLNIGDYFCVQRSTDGNVFQTISTINSNSGNAYNYEDISPENGNNFYRIKMIRNGVNSYSSISKEFIANGLLEEFNSSFINNILTLSIPANAESFYISVINTYGQILQTQQYNKTNIPVDFRISLKRFQKGVYYIKFGGKDLKSHSIKLLRT